MHRKINRMNEFNNANSLFEFIMFHAEHQSCLKTNKQCVNLLKHVQFCNCNKKKKD